MGVYDDDTSELKQQFAAAQEAKEEWDAIIEISTTL